MEHWWSDMDMVELRCCEKNIIKRLWQVYGWELNMGGMILTRETVALGQKYYRAWVLDE